MEKQVVILFDRQNVALTESHLANIIGRNPVEVGEDLPVDDARLVVGLASVLVVLPNQVLVVQHLVVGSLFKMEKIILGHLKLFVFLGQKRR